MSPAKRLKFHDYSSPGQYFVTICSNYKRLIFGTVVGSRIELSALGRIAREAWVGIPTHFAGVNLQAFVVMPNHAHGIIEMTGRLAQHAVPLQREAGARNVIHPGSLSAIVRSYKSEVTRRARLEIDWKDEIWQHNYFDRVIRDAREFASASRYIAENPARWNAMKRRFRETANKQAQHAVPLQGTRL